MDPALVPDVLPEVAPDEDPVELPDPDVAPEPEEAPVDVPEVVPDDVPVELPELLASGVPPLPLSSDEHAAIAIKVSAATLHPRAKRRADDITVISCESQWRELLGLEGAPIARAGDDRRAARTLAS
ncbi:MAG TPA: hypothetical protein VKU41_29435 [Polyangiaceae bacterium]|nr:hypothetical protein [Polyangiaceae bacterium]